VITGFVHSAQGQAMKERTIVVGRAGEGMGKDKRDGKKKNVRQETGTNIKAARFRERLP